MNKKIKHIPIKITEIHHEHIGKPVLHKNKGAKEYGVIAGLDNQGVYIFFGMTDAPMWLGFQSTNELYLTEIL